MLVALYRASDSTLRLDVVDTKGEFRSDLPLGLARAKLPDA